MSGSFRTHLFNTQVVNSVNKYCTSKMFPKLKKVFSSCLQQENLNIYVILKPFYYLISLVGLFPFGIKYNESKSRFKIVYNAIYMNAVCAVSINIVMYTFFIIHVQDLFSAQEANTLSDVFITQMNYILELSTLLIYCTVAYVTAFLNRYRYVKILNAITSILSESKTEPDFKLKVLERLKFQIHVVVMGSLLFVLILQLCVNCTRDDSLWKMTMVTFSFIVPQMIQMIGLAFHYILVMMLVTVLSDINQQLLRLTKEPKNIITEEMFMKVDSKQPKITLRHLQLMYSKAYEIKCDINNIFQASLLMSTFQCFHCIVSEGYSIYHGLIAKTHTTHNTINNSIWMLYQLIKAFSLAYSGSGLISESLNIGKTLHNIPTDKQDLRTLLEIQHFSTSMTYQDFVLSVYGYFNLNANLMATMVATAMMYLIIFVQFDKSALNPKVTPENNKS